MLKKIAAVAGGVLIGLAIAFARAGAFPFWGSDSGASKAPPPAQQAQANPAEPLPAPPVPGVHVAPAVQPAEPNAPEPGEKVGVITSFAPLVKKMIPAVVSVNVVQDVKVSGMPFGGGQGGPGDDNGGDDDPGAQGGGGDQGGGGGLPPGGGGGDPFDQLRRYFGQGGQREYKQHGLGSGVIVSADGYILTNNHVVGNADEIHVTLQDKREFTAKVIGKDAKTDLGLIKIDTKDALPVAPLGDSNTTDVGDWVIAIGNPFNVGMTVTAGIVSAKGRILGGDYDDFIQTDASINPGNSGGPLINTKGEVIGINTAIYSRTGANNGIGFAIPIDMARNVMDQLKAHGTRHARMARRRDPGSDARPRAVVRIAEARGRAGRQCRQGRPRWQGRNRARRYRAQLQRPSGGRRASTAGAGRADADQSEGAGRGGAQRQAHRRSRSRSASARNRRWRRPRLRLPAATGACRSATSRPRLRSSSISKTPRAW